MSTFYYVESKDKKGKTEIVGHSQDEKTKEVYYKFLDRAKAKKLMSDEKKVSPQYQYRINKVITRMEVGKWE